MPSPNYIDGQSEITWDMRATLIDWLLQVHLRYHLLPETLWIAINIVDRFLSKRVVSLVKLQLVGVTAMFIAANYEEIIAPGYALRIAPMPYSDASLQGRGTSLHHRMP